jgi:two-component system phosphate regulon response regulator PhoB
MAQSGGLAVRPTVLVVEDDVAVQALILPALEEAGYRVLQAYRASDAEALAAAHLSEIDVLVTDEVIPGTSGIHFARRLRASRDSIRVVCMSGYLKEDVGKSDGEGLVAAFLFKPFSMETLVETVKRVLAS